MAGHLTRWVPDLKRAPSVDELVNELMNAVALRISGGCGLVTHTESKGSNGEWDGTFSGWASTSDPDHDAWILPGSSWVGGMPLYMRNPVGLYNHDFDRIIFRTLGFSIEDRGLHIHGVMNLRNGFASERAQEIRDGFLRTFSVQFIPLDEPKVLDGKLVFPRNQLLETSFVSVPANPYALLDERSAERVMKWHGEKRRPFVPEKMPEDKWLRFVDEVRMRRVVAEVIDERLLELSRVRKEQISSALDAIGNVFQRTGNAA